MKAGAVSIVADCKKINTETNFITLGNVSLDQPSFVMKVIPALQPANSKEPANKPAAASASPLNINADEITISKGALDIDSDFEKPYPNFDGTHRILFHHYCFYYLTIYSCWVVVC